MGNSKGVEQILFSYDGIKFGKCWNICDMWCGKSHAYGVGEEQKFSKYW